MERIVHITRVFSVLSVACVVSRIMAALSRGGGILVLLLPFALLLHAEARINIFQRDLDNMFKYIANVNKEKSVNVMVDDVMESSESLRMINTIEKSLLKVFPTVGTIDSPKASSGMMPLVYIYAAEEPPNFQVTKRIAQVQKDKTIKDSKKIQKALLILFTEKRKRKYEDLFMDMKARMEIDFDIAEIRPARTIAKGSIGVPSYRIWIHQQHPKTGTYNIAPWSSMVKLFPLKREIKKDKARRDDSIHDLPFYGPMNKPHQKQTKKQ